MLLTVLVLAIASASVLLGLIVFSRNTSSLYHATFSLFAITLGLWICANYFGSLYNPQPRLAFLFYADFAIAPLLAFLFASYGTQSIKFYRRDTLVANKAIIVLVIFATAAAALAAATHLVVEPSYRDGTVISIKQAFYNPYIALLLGLVVTGLLSLLYATISAGKIYKNQTKIILWGISVSAIILLASNIILSSSKIAQIISYVAITGMLFTLSYSIVRYKLFDIRLLIVRSLTYSLVALVLILAYLFIVFIVGSQIFGDAKLSLFQQAYLFLLITVTSLSYPRLRKYFDRLSERIFYKSFYNAQATVEQYSKDTRRLVELNQLIKTTNKTLTSTINPVFINYYIKDIEASNFELIKNQSSKTEIEIETEKIQKYANKNHTIDVLAYDRLDAVEPVHEYMTKENVGAILIVRSGIHPDAFILLGVKESGGFYSKQDVQLLSIISSQFAVAFQNALRFEEIQQFNVTLQQKVEEATKQLRNANKRLKELDQTKDEFISMASHQLRTPLTTIKGYLSMVLEGDVGPITKNEKKMIQQAFDSAERMVFLIADLLNVSRLQSGKFVIDNKPTDLAKMIRTEVEQLKDTAAHHNLSLTCRVPSKMPLLALDETKIRQVVMNFLDNAIYYTPAGGSISVELELTSESIKYTVTDTGLGVPKEEQHHLFSKFYRAGNARKMRPDGTGLGLFMARKVIVAQGGSVIFKSTEGKGSTFGFSFPRHKLEIKGKHPENQVTEPAAA